MGVVDHFVPSVIDWVPMSSTGNFFSHAESKHFRSEPSQQIVTTEKCFPTSRNQSGHGLQTPREEIAFTACKVIREKSRGEGSLIVQDTIENVSEPKFFF